VTTAADIEGRGRASVFFPLFLFFFFFLVAFSPPVVVSGCGEKRAAEGRQAAQCQRYNEARQTAGLTALAGDAWSPC